MSASLHEPAVHGYAAAKGHLKFTRSLLEIFPFDDPRRRHWQDRLTQVSARLTDPCHYLAIIGEFSSGKTTFINALLGAELFATSALPTTAASVSIRHGAKFTVRATFTNGTRWPTANGRSVPELWGLDLKSALTRLTTGDTLAPNVVSVEVEHPAPVLADGLVIIDTPGTNAEQGHSAIARTAVSNADAAVVVLTALQLVPDSLRQFLTDALDTHLLARCGYVVTRMDQIEPEERERIHRSALGRVTGRLGVTDPALVLSAPSVVTRDLRGEQLTADECSWLGRFTDTRRWLYGLVEANRPIAVADTALRLIDAILRDLDGALAADLKVLHEQRQALDSARVADMNGFLSRQSVNAKVLLKSGREAASAALERAYSATLGQVRAEIDTVIGGCASKGALEQVLRNQVPALVRRHADALAGTVVGTVRTELGARFDQAAQAVAAAFDREYAKLEKASGSPRTPDPVVSRLSAEDLVPTGSFANAVAVAVADQSRDNKAIGAGAGAGALIGTLILPGPGTVIGAVVGAFFGGATTRNLAEAKTEAKGNATGTAESILGTVRSRLVTAISDATDRHERAFADHLEWYRAKYQHVVDGLRQTYARRDADLRARGERLAAARAQTGERRAAVAAERADL